MPLLYEEYYDELVEGIPPCDLNIDDIEEENLLNGWLKVIVKCGDICNENCDAITSTANCDLTILTRLGEKLCSKSGP